ncbi:hypothetical protein RND81_03G193600 [Saponaria officinalis]|uniref:SCP domain-containing protein n=1 Tax=Saponaria officinalis TaxID=3572 RepID=A0AAW1MAS5_SAPOF
MLMLKGFLCFHLVFICALVFSAQVYSTKTHAGNSAKDIVDIINKNRTSLKLPPLYDNPGLGCIALQYAKQCNDNCTSNNSVTCHPLEDDFTQIFAPDCGVELPTFQEISGHIIGCWSKYLEPADAFSEVLIRDNRSLTLLQNKTHTEVGVGVVSSRTGHFFWCVLFSNAEIQSSFVLEDRGVGIMQKEGCFSGTNITCSEANRRTIGIMFSSFLVIFTSFFLFWLLQL